MKSIHSALLLLSIIISVKSLRAQDADDDCRNVTTCVECLETEACGAWAVGSCLESCDLIADAPCYDDSTFSNLTTTAEETCQAAADIEADAALCASQTDCGTCTDTVLMDGNTTCQWNPNGNFCASSCGLAGCGVYECQADDCSAIMSCESCLDSACAWVPQEGCLPSCNVVADVSCYTNETFPNKSSEESCQAVADASADSSLCASQTDCSDCTGTVLSDGNTTCQWFPDGEYCASGCGMTGCGVDTCADNACDGLSCNECLADDGDESCAWVPVEGCLSSCDIIADTACFPAVDYNASEVCEEEPVEEEPAATAGGSTPTSGGERAFSTCVGAAGSLFIITATVLMLQ